MKAGVVALALVPCAYFAARGAGHLLAASRPHLDAPRSARAESFEPAPSAPDYHVRDRRVVLRRNVFDSSAGRLDGAAEPPSSATPGAAAGGALAPCEGAASVLGGAVGSDAAWSFALVRSSNDAPATPVHAGHVLDGKVVRAVGWHPYRGTQLLLEGSRGARCYLAEHMPPRPAVTARTQAVGAPTNGSAGEVERTGPGSVTVRRGLVERVLSDPSEVMATTRVMPYFDGGRLAGVRLAGVGEATLLGRLGLRSGDVIESVNGLAIATPDGALEALTRLRTADHLRVAVRRGGAPVTLDVDVR